MAGNIGTLVEHELYFPNTPIFFLEKSISNELLPAFAESLVRKGWDECEKGIHRSLLTAIASAAAVGEGFSAYHPGWKDNQLLENFECSLSLPHYRQVSRRI